MNAFRALDFSDAAVDSIWKMVAVILHIGNLEFYADDKDHVQNNSGLLSSPHLKRR
jgi:myosin heavy subunit